MKVTGWREAFIWPQGFPMLFPLPVCDCVRTLILYMPQFHEWHRHRGSGRSKSGRGGISLADNLLTVSFTWDLIKRSSKRVSEPRGERGKSEGGVQPTPSPAQREPPAAPRGSAPAGCLVLLCILRTLPDRAAAELQKLCCFSSSPLNMRCSLLLGYDHIPLVQAPRVSFSASLSHTQVLRQAEKAEAGVLSGKLRGSGDNVCCL